MTPETDINLLEGLRKQSPKAQQQMLDRYGRDVFAQVVRLIPVVENAEEVYQDVFVKVFKNIVGYRGGGHLRTAESRNSTTDQGRAETPTTRRTSHHHDVLL